MLLVLSNQFTMAGVDALIAPKPFKTKDKDPETLLIDFDLYIKAVNNFFVATDKDNASNKQKIALLQAVGGVDMIGGRDPPSKVCALENQSVRFGYEPRDSSY